MLKILCFIAVFILGNISGIIMISLLKCSSTDDSDNVVITKPETPEVIDTESCTLDD